MSIFDTLFVKLSLLCRHLMVVVALASCVSDVSVAERAVGAEKKGCGQSDQKTEQALAKRVESRIWDARADLATALGYQTNYFFHDYYHGLNVESATEAFMRAAGESELDINIGRLAAILHDYRNEAKEQPTKRNAKGFLKSDGTADEYDAYFNDRSVRDAQGRSNEEQSALVVEGVLRGITLGLNTKIPEPKIERAKNAIMGTEATGFDPVDGILRAKIDTADVMSLALATADLRLLLGAGRAEDLLDEAFRLWLEDRRDVQWYLYNPPGGKNVRTILKAQEDKSQFLLWEGRFTKSLRDFVALQPMLAKAEHRKMKAIFERATSEGQGARIKEAFQSAYPSVLNSRFIREIELAVSQIPAPTPESIANGTDTLPGLIARLSKTDFAIAKPRGDNLRISVFGLED